MKRNNNNNYDYLEDNKDIDGDVNYLDLKMRHFNNELPISNRNVYNDDATTNHYVEYSKAKSIENNPSKNIDNKR